VEESVWKSRVREDANKEDLGSCYRSQGDVQTKKEKDLPLIQKQKRSPEFVEDQLRKGYIRPLKSSQISPVFFVRKKARSKRIVIDYHNLNNQIVKNNYLLPLITDLIDNMGNKKVFTKIDLR